MTALLTKNDFVNYYNIKTGEKLNQTNLNKGQNKLKDEIIIISDILGLTNISSFVPGNSYLKDDKVLFNGVVYVAKINTSGTQNPDVSNDWEPLPNMISIAKNVSDINNNNVQQQTSIEKLDLTTSNSTTQIDCSNFSTLSPNPDVYVNGILLNPQEYTVNVSDKKITVNNTIDSNSWIHVVNVIVIGSSNIEKSSQIASNGQTVFYVSDFSTLNSNPEVFVNGILVKEEDRTIDTQNKKITFKSPLNENDWVRIINI